MSVACGKVWAIYFFNGNFWFIEFILFNKVTVIMYRIFNSILFLLFTISGCTTIDNEIFKHGKALFNNEWEFTIDSFGFTGPDQFINGDGIVQWEGVSLPHTAKIEPLVVNDQWQGTCWYRKIFATQDSWDGKKLFLRFEGAMNVAELWVNGNKKITHLGGYLPFVADITDDINQEGINSIYVRLDNKDNPITGPKPLKTLDFNMYGGLYRDVFLILKNPVHISDEQFANIVAGGGIFVTYPEVTRKHATVSVKTHIVNSGKDLIQLKVSQSLERKGKRVAGSSQMVTIEAGKDREMQQELEVRNPLLWSPQSPDLYDLKTIVSHKGRIFDKQITQIGIRRFEFKKNSLYINGVKTFLRGTNRHQEYPYIGYALSNNAQYRDAVKIKKAGFDFVRLSHYPQSKAFLDACDELGIITLDAILGWQYYLEDEQFKQHIMQTCRDMIRRDRNHSSVLAWEVSLNESWMPESFIDSLNKIAHEEYPGGDCHTSGWQTYGYDIYLQARQHRLEDPGISADKPYIVSEYGDWEYYAMNAGLNQDAWDDLLPEERSSRQALGSGEKRLLQQALNLQEAHNDNFTTPAVADGYWVMFDYNRGYADDLETSGIMSIFRLPKISYYFFQSQRDPGEPVYGSINDPMAFIASYWSEGSPQDVRVFSNCEEVELLLNGVSLGSKTPDKDRISGNLNHPPFTFRDVPLEPGKLVAIGKLDGKQVARHEVSTPGKPASILLEADISGRAWENGFKDVIFLHAKVLDQNNQIVHEFADNVNFSISGKASIIGKHSPKAECGIATVLLMAGDEPDEVTITAMSGDIKSKPYKIIIE
jgi:beta-galactosidase